MIVLCSGSPRRKSLLESLGVKFTTYKPEINEAHIIGESPEDYVARMSRTKAEAGSAKFPDDIVISADTIVVIDGEILGKPSDREDAARMLRKLSGREHEVMTGLTVYSNGAVRSRTVHTSVTFRELTGAEISAYVATGECDDKAGAYAIQGKGSVLITHINGDYYNVMGLPLCELYNILKSEGINLL